MKALLIRKFANLRSGLAVLRPMQALRAAPSLRASSTGPASGCVATASQTTDTVLMVSPKYFHMNAATATDNKYQNLPRHLEQAGPDEVSSLAMREFTGLVSLLRDRGVQVNVEEPPEEHRECADAVFPNNWVSFHKGKIALYPMKTENRRKERRQDVIERWSRDLRAEVVDYSSWEREGKFLEGTGSMVLDRVNKVCYACISQRTHPAVLAEFCKDFGYKAVTFEATQEGPDGELWPVYHTNVICSVGDSFALLCTECIRDTEQRRAVVDAITSSGKELVDVKEKQVYDFAANSLQLHSTHGERLLVMSTAAYQSFDAEQLEALRRHVNHILHVPLPTIEALGGGGARCMLAEVFS
jgi:hypothetical protein